VSPLIVIFAILAGNQIHGVLGMLLAIPLIPFLKAALTFFGPRVHWQEWDATGVTGVLGEPAAREGKARGPTGETG
jgi:predicted PurR-regulated permease PerM